jgi:hypothetical protein
MSTPDFVVPSIEGGRLRVIAVTPLSNHVLIMVGTDVKVVGCEPMRSGYPQDKTSGSGFSAAVSPRLCDEEGDRE